MKLVIAVVALSVGTIFHCAAQTDEEVLLSYLSGTGTVGQQAVYIDEDVSPEWIVAMQERWGETTSLKDLDFYQKIQTESVAEIVQVYEKTKAAPAKRAKVSQDIGAIVKKYADKYNVSEDLVIALIQTESAFNPNATSPKGAKGLMQLMDIHSKKHQIDPYDPDDNVKVGTALLAGLLYKYQDIKLALAAYNAGEGAVNKYGGIPPYKETKNYVSKIIGMIGE